MDSDKKQPMKALLILAFGFAMTSGFGQSLVKPSKPSLASVLLEPFNGDSVLITKDLKRDLAAFAASLPEPERLLILASTSFEGSRGNHSAKEDKINAPKGSPIGLILMWIGEYHRAGLEFDGFKITFRYLGIPPRPDSRWYSLSPALLDAFVEVPKAQNVTMDYATSAIKQNEMDMIKGVKVSAVNDAKIQLTGPVASLDSLDRWISIKFMKMVGEDHRKRRVPFPAGKN